MEQPDTMQAAGTVSISTAGAPGARLNTEHMQRTMRAWPLTEVEVNSLTTLSTQATVFFAVGSATLGLPIGIWTNRLFATSLSPEASVACNILAPVLLFFAVVFFGLGFKAWSDRKSEWQSIKEQATRDASQPR
jgi:hypothetical protein